MISREALGVGLRPTHYAHLLECAPEIDFFEIITENFLGDAELPRRHLDFFRERYPLVLHGVSLNLLGSEEPGSEYLDRVARLAELVKAPYFTDHLCWTGVGTTHHHDLLPTPYVEDLIGFAAERAARVQKHVGIPFGIENLSSYVSFRESTLSEWEFYCRIVKGADCFFMLDINNIYVSSVNHGFSPELYLDAIDFRRVLQAHLAGHSVLPQGHIIDTHDHPVADPVWELYRRAWKRGGPFPTLLEWDDRIPEFPIVHAEVLKAKVVRS